MHVRAFVRASLVLCALAAQLPLYASVVYVNKNAPGAVHDGRSWGTAFTTVQAAVNVAANGDEVWVAAGVYAGNVVIPAAVSASLYGGFSGTETTRASRTLGHEATVLNGGGGTVVLIIAPNVTVDGFTIRGGSRGNISSAQTAPAGQGSGVYCAGNSGVVSHNLITANVSGGTRAGASPYVPNSGYGGGIVCAGNNALILSNTICGNAAIGTSSWGVGPWMESAYAEGGGMYVTGSDVVVLNNTISANTVPAQDLPVHPPDNMSVVFSTGMYGGGISCAGPRPVIRGNTISSNTVQQFGTTTSYNYSAPAGNAGGGGLWVTGAGAVIADNVIVNNLVTANSSGRGGGIGAKAPITLINNTICGNSAMYDTGQPATGGSIYTFSAATLMNNIVAFNVGPLSLTGPMTSHNDFFGETVAPGTKDITSDPLFVDRANGDYHLKSGSPCIDAGDDSVVTSGETDLDGNPRIRGAHVDIGAYEVPAPTTSVSLGASVFAPPSAVDGVVYIAGENGKLYALASSDLNPVAGFPVDISAAVGTAVKLNTRPAVYYGKAGKAIYLTTNLGHVVKVWPSGQVAWTAKPLTGPTMSTPAVTPDGSVYVDLGLGSSNVASYLFKLDEVTGLATYVSPYLGSSPANALIDRSAAIDQRYAYVNASGQTLGSLAVLNQDNLTVRASFAPGEDALAPFLNGRNIYVATKAGSVYKVNGITMSPYLSFGSLGRVTIGEGVTAGPFLDAGGSVYVGTASGKVWKLDGTTGVKSLFVDSGTNSAVVGLLVTRNALAFATASGTLQQISLTDHANKAVENLSGPPAGGPVYDSEQGRLIVATTAGQVYSIPSL